MVVYAWPNKQRLAALLAPQETGRRDYDCTKIAAVECNKLVRVVFDLTPALVLPRSNTSPSAVAATKRSPFFLNLIIASMRVYHKVKSGVEFEELGIQL